MGKNRQRQGFSVCFPKQMLESEPIQRLRELAKKRGRSIAYVVMEAIFQYLDKEEKSLGGGKEV